MNDIPERWLDRVPTQIADLTRERKEKELARKARYEATERAKMVRAKYAENRKSYAGKPDRHPARKIARENRPFVIWDGEQPRDTGYSLFGNSEGLEICHPHLGSKECLDLIIEQKIVMPDAIHCWFGGDFDSSWIVNDLSWRQLGRLKHYNSTQWQGYEITHVPHKWFSVKYGDIKATVFDIWSFFGSGLVPALEDWNIGPFAGGQNVSSPKHVEIPTLTAMSTMTEQEIVRIFKFLRGEFEWKDIQQIAIYMRLELKYTKQLIESMRETFLQAGYLPNSWHGPGALSRMAMKRHNVYAAMKQSPKPVIDAARFGYFGGRFTPHLVGHMEQTIYSYDLNNAYPYAATLLPNLAKGKWRFENELSRIRDALNADKFAIYNLTFFDRNPYERLTQEWMDHVSRTVWEMYPLPMRSRYHSGISYPLHVKGWYWAPEARMVMNDPRVEFHGAWIFDEDDSTDRPFTWLEEYYRRRMLLKKVGNPAQYTFKTIMNGEYGQLAQRVGWDQIGKKAPRSHQLEWAGYITSHCRASMWNMVERVGQDNVISIDTDGIMTLIPIELTPEEDGDWMGQWKTEVYSEGVFWQSGVYGLKVGNKWEKAKTRGIPRGKYKPEQLVEMVHQRKKEFTINTSRFIGYGAAFNGQRDMLNTWITDPQEYRFGGSGATYHQPRNCKTTCSGNIHRLKNNVQPDITGRVPKVSPWHSAPHFLPWADNTKEMWASVALEDDWTYHYIGEDDA